MASVAHIPGVSPAELRLLLPGALSAALLLGLALSAAGDGPARISQATATPAPELAAELGKTCTREGPLGTVTRELYLPYPKPNASSVLTAGYVGNQGLRRYEVLTYQVHDDVYQDAERRYSEDNGRSWAAWQQDAEAAITCEGDYSWQKFPPTGPSEPCYDPQSGRLVQPYSLVSFAGDPRQTGLRGTNYHTF